MNEKVVVNTGLPSYLPKFKNPIYQAALETKEKLRNEILLRIKTGDFKEGLYPLVKNITLTSEELENIINCWKSQSYQSLVFLYEIVLRTNDLEKIKEADNYLFRLFKEKEEKSR